MTICKLNARFTLVERVMTLAPNATNDAVEAGLDTLYRITATACHMPTAAGVCPGATDATGIANVNYVERRLEAVVEAPQAAHDKFKQLLDNLYQISL